MSKKERRVTTGSYKKFGEIRWKENFLVFSRILNFQEGKLPLTYEQKLKLKLKWSQRWKAPKHSEKALQ